LHRVNEKLKKFGHVNKKAFEQYQNFTTQRDSLNERKGELDTSAKSIQDLIKVLDQRKDEAIERTFGQVCTNFEEIFERLVPAGYGRLIMQRKDDEDASQDSMELSQDSLQEQVEKYIGIAIKVGL